MGTKTTKLTKYNFILFVYFMIFVVSNTTSRRSRMTQWRNEPAPIRNPLHGFFSSYPATNNAAGILYIVATQRHHLILKFSASNDL